MPTSPAYATMPAIIHSGRADMIKRISQNLTALGKVIVVIIVAGAIAAAVILAYNLIGTPEPPL